MKWITNCRKAEAEAVINKLQSRDGKIVVGDPMRTDDFTAKELKSFDMVGLYEVMP